MDVAQDSAGAPDRELRMSSSATLVGQRTLINSGPVSGVRSPSLEDGVRLLASSPLEPSPTDACFSQSAATAGESLQECLEHPIFRIAVELNVDLGPQMIGKITQRPSCRDRHQQCARLLVDGEFRDRHWIVNELD